MSKSMADTHTTKNISQSIKPEILAPAGSKSSFLAAIAAGADAIYCGFKQFSARMQAKNFKLTELVSLTDLAHQHNAKVYLTLNSIIKSGELDSVGQTTGQIVAQVNPDALIIQDPSLIEIAHQSGFKGEIHLSTLANVSFRRGLDFVQKEMPVDRVVLPRELTVDEIKQMAMVCSPQMGLEVFVHGALCYGVSGRCYWSSYLGGKSGLRGQCVQPCRRFYRSGSKRKKFFSCQDLSLDVLAKVLLKVSAVRAWKIEGRKKGPHYVYYTVRAYQTLRDYSTDSHAKKSALQMLAYALGRKGTHYNFLSQRRQNPIDTDHQTASGMLVGHVKGARPKPFISPREKLLPKDTLRIGYEEDRWHTLLKINQTIPKGGRFYLKSAAARRPAKGTPVFLTDRRDEALTALIDDLSAKMTVRDALPDSIFRLKRPQIKIKNRALLDLVVFRSTPKRHASQTCGQWLVPEIDIRLPKGRIAATWWWLPPVTWPSDEDKIFSQVKRVLAAGGKYFILNAPWQIEFFANKRGLELWAGPFCNIANFLAVKVLKQIGFKGAIISPELGRQEIITLPQNSPLPLGLVTNGLWPLCIARTLAGDLQIDTALFSPKRERAWVRKYGAHYWVYPDWQLDLNTKRKDLEKAGYRLFIKFQEPAPAGIKIRKRSGMWNWRVGLR